MPLIPASPGQRPGGRGPHAHREQQRARRPGERGVGVVQQRLGDGHGEPGGRGVQTYRGAADDVQQVAEGAGAHGPSFALRADTVAAGPGGGRPGGWPISSETYAGVVLMYNVSVATASETRPHDRSDRSDRNT
ncbi:hypothetical protein ACWKT5_00660 [Streptomyces avermitilis]